MLSILIPIYNFDVRQFVNELHFQAEKESVEFEIILADDASNSNFRQKNQETEKLLKVKYFQLEKNIGRSKIRNFLAAKAKFDYLLFADCDMAAKKQDFIRNYLKFITIDSIICGGITYTESIPENSDFLFRWYYGNHREKMPLKKRIKSPYSSFMSGNFLIPKILFNQIKFNESIVEYGHEDTLFGIELKKRNIPVIHIENPLIHNGLEESKVFIQKTENGIKNLISVTGNNQYPELFEDIKLLSVSKKIRLFRPIILLIFNLFKNLILKNLKSRHPNLIFFDFYKLGYYYKNTVKT